MDPLNEEMKNLLYPDEVVKYVPGFKNKYIASNLGRIFSVRKGYVYVTLKGEKYTANTYRELKTFYVNGYKTVCLSKKEPFMKSERKNYYVHELVIKAFCYEYNKSFFRIKHINKKKDDNRLVNLRLEFRKKYDKDFIENYEKQQRILALLNE